LADETVLRLSTVSPFRGARYWLFAAVARIQDIDNYKAMPNAGITV